VPDVQRYQVGAVTLTRVPYFDVGLDPASLQLNPAAVDQVTWARPAWVDPVGRVLVGQAVWVIESEGRRIVVDPCGAADAFIRTGPEAITHQQAVLEALRAAGLPADKIDVVLLSHLDGIGMTALACGDGSWEPAFPNARILMTTAELDYVAEARQIPSQIQGLAALHSLMEQGAVDGIGPPFACTSEVTVVETGGHSPGHAVVHVRSGEAHAVFLGHLAITPVHVAVARGPGFHHEAAPAEAALESVLAAAAAEGTLVAGPLWPAPGAGYVSGPPWVITPALD